MLLQKHQRNATEPDDPASNRHLRTTSVPLLIFRQIYLQINECLSFKFLDRNRLAFGLDGRLGNYDAHVKIPLKPNAVPVSLPPFPASPANREVMDKQLDSWIQLGVIEPSSSLGLHLPS
ncbi:hypothetical protein BDZ89DRAFT_1146808 [Hymenopellis radicata]|nr:hypothetical protein BDZ89DRAFT_1146808 [Hymenopellis radicata]